MLNYIIRRILIMIPTLFGITVMVFCIARFAPGRPGVSTIGQVGEQDAEGQKKMREWYDKRMGLDLPFYRQYFRWWGGLIFSETEARAWTESFEPIYTYRRSDPEYYTLDVKTNQWYVLSDIDVMKFLSLQNDPVFTRQIGDVDQLPIPLLEVDPNYHIPGHFLVTGQLTAVDESFDVGVLVPATDMGKVKVDAPAWTRAGRPVYRHPDDPNPDLPSLFLYQNEDGAWFEIQSDKPVDKWTEYTQDDPSFKNMLSYGDYKDLTEVVDGRPIPRHLIASGQPKILEGKMFEVESLTRMVGSVEASLESWLWTKDGWPILVADEPVVTKIYQDADGQWCRMIGANRLTEPTFKTYKQTDPHLLKQLSEKDVADLPKAVAGKTKPRQVVMTGTSFPLDDVPEERNIRRYSHSIRVMDFPLGTSLTSHTTVISEIKQRLPVTLGINLVAFPIIYIIALPTGMMMALKRGRGFDYGSNAVLLGLWSVPYVLTATLAIGYLAEGGKGPEWLAVFPTSGLKSSEYAQMTSILDKLGDRAMHLILPISCMVYGGFAYLAKQMRAAMLENFTMDYVRTARAKGVSMRNIVLVHVLRNSLIPIITIFATILPALIAGSVILETVFNIEGMGLFAFRAVKNRDYDVIQTMALIFGVLNLASLLIADIVYAIVDPRIAYK